MEEEKNRFVEVPRPPLSLDQKERLKIALNLLDEMWREPEEKGFLDRAMPFLLLGFGGINFFLLILIFALKH